MGSGRLPNSVCRMCPFLNLNLLVRPGSIFESRRLPLVAVLFVTVSFACADCGLAVCCGRRVCEFIFRMCRHPVYVCAYVWMCQNSLLGSNRRAGHRTGS